MDSEEREEKRPDRPTSFRPWPQTRIYLDELEGPFRNRNTAINMGIAHLHWETFPEKHTDKED